MTMKFEGRYRIEFHPGPGYPKYKYAVDRLDIDPDGRRRLVNVGWYTSLRAAQKVVAEAICAQTRHKARTALTGAPLTGAMK